MPRKSAKVKTTDSPGATSRAGTVSPSELMCSGPPDAMIHVQFGPYEWDFPYISVEWGPILSGSIMPPRSWRLYASASL